MTTEVYTVATEERPGLARLRDSLTKFSIPLIVLGVGEEFRGYCWRLKQVVKAARTSQADLIVHADAYDSACLGPLDSLVNEYSQLNQPIIWSREKNPQPEYWLSLNPGLMIADRKALVSLFTDALLERFFPDHFNDMSQLQALWAMDRSLFDLDWNERCFFTQQSSNPKIAEGLRP